MLLFYDPILKAVMEHLPFRGILQHLAVVMTRGTQDV
jgi:hypothetical protein